MFHKIVLSCFTKLFNTHNITITYWDRKMLMICFDINIIEYYFIFMNNGTLAFQKHNIFFIKQILLILNFKFRHVLTMNK